MKHVIHRMLVLLAVFVGAPPVFPQPITIPHPIPTLPQPNLTRYANVCSTAALTSCLTDVIRDIFICNQKCLQAMGGICDCSYTKKEVDDCQRLYGCDPGMACKEDVSPPKSGEICCRPEEMDCKGQCAANSCAGNFVFDPNSCGCQCPLQCRFPTRLNPSSCECVCSDICTDGMVQDPKSCQCSCPALQSDCGGTCKNLEDDSKNCGSCGNVCPKNSRCAHGACVCAFPMDLCNGQCMDLRFDPENCGTCGKACAQGEGCCNKVCKPLNTNTDCGTCGKPCPSGRSCQNGSCACPSGKTDCGGTCVDLQTDHDHCGSCAYSCTLASFVCQNGKCICGPTNTSCGTNSCCPTNYPVCCGNNHCCPSSTPLCCPPTSAKPNGYCCPSNTKCCSGTTGCCY